MRDIQSQLIRILPSVELSTCIRLLEGESPLASDNLVITELSIEGITSTSSTKNAECNDERVVDVVIDVDEYGQ